MADETLQRDQLAPAAPEKPAKPASPPDQGRVAPSPDQQAPGTRDQSAPATAAPMATAEPATVWPAETARGFRDRWQEIQLRFVDDPRGATSDAETLLAEVLDVFSETLAAHKAEVDTWGDADGADVERLRTAVRRYRDLLERLLGM